jgi:hypothetical protein
VGFNLRENLVSCKRLSQVQVREGQGQVNDSKIFVKRSLEM